MEKTTAYFDHPHVPERVFNSIPPNVRMMFIFLARDPIERLQSSVNYEMDEGGNGSLKEYVIPSAGRKPRTVWFWSSVTRQ